MVYAVGDIHGRDDLLQRLLDKIIADHQRTPVLQPPPVLVFLGDYVDRGLASRQVIERILGLDPFRFELRCLKGNHEAALTDFLDDPTTGPGWFAIGGAETLYSYGVRAPIGTPDPLALEHAAVALRRAMPERHQTFLRNLELMTQVGDYVFVHAGVNPERPLEDQDEHDLLETREPFAGSRKRPSYIVVHGHTPAADVVMDRRRLCLDTGAYVTGKLSAVRLQDGEVAVIST